MSSEEYELDDSTVHDMSEDEDASPLERAKPVAKKSKRKPRKVLELEPPEREEQPVPEPEPEPDVAPSPIVDEDLLAYMQTDHYKNKSYLKPPEVIEKIVETIREVPVETIREIPVERTVYVDRLVRDIPDVAFGRSRRSSRGWL